MKIKRKNIQVFDIVNTIFMIFVVVVMLYPMYYTVMASVSDAGALARHTGLLLSPVGDINFEAYKIVLTHRNIGSGFANTIFLLTVGLFINMVLTTFGAYFLAMKGPKLQGIIAFMIVFTMYFSGGMVPEFLNVRDLGLYNSRWALVLPGAITTMNLIILKSGFQAVPESLIESARLDGAAYMQVLLQVMIPLTKSSLAVILLYCGVGHWNNWFNASIYLTDSAKFPLQLVVRNILNFSSGIAISDGADEMSRVAELMKYALIVVSTVPILAIYPFLQKYFVKGTMIGAVKG